MGQIFKKTLNILNINRWSSFFLLSLSFYF